MLSNFHFRVPTWEIVKSVTTERDMDDLNSLLIKILEERERKKEPYAQGPLEKMGWLHIDEQRALVKQNEQALEDKTSWQYLWVRFMEHKPELRFKMTFGHKVDVRLVTQRHVKNGEECPSHLVPLLVIEQMRTELSIISPMMSEEEWGKCLGAIIQKGISGSPYNWGKKDLAYLKPKPPKKPKVVTTRRVIPFEAKKRMADMLKAAKDGGVKITIGKVNVQQCEVKNLDKHKMNWSKCIRTCLYSPMHETKEMKYTPSTRTVNFVKEPTPELEKDLSKILRPGIRKREVMDEIRRKGKPPKKKCEQNTLAPRIYKTCMICQYAWKGHDSKSGKEVTLGAANKVKHEKKYHGSRFFLMEEIRKNDNAWYPVKKIVMPK